MSLAGLKLSDLQQVVTARSIGTVLVVDTPSGFATGGIAGVTSATKLKVNNPSLNFQFALAGGESGLTLSAPVYSSMASAGFSFVNETGLTGFTNALVLGADSVDVANGVASLNNSLKATSGGQQLVDLSQTNANGRSNLKIFDGVVNSDTAAYFGLSANTGAPITISSDGSWSMVSTLSDFNGTVKVNLSASEFAEIARRNGSTNPLRGDQTATAITISKTNDLLVGPALSPLSSDPNAGPLQPNNDLPLVIAKSTGDILGGGLTSISATAGVNSVLTESGISEKVTGVTSINSYSTATGGISATKLTINGFRISGALIKSLSREGLQLGNYNLNGEAANGNNGKYLLINDGTIELNAKEFRSLPNEGVETVTAGTVNDIAENDPKATQIVLKDTAANISLLLPQLTAQQLGSIAELKIYGANDPIQVNVSRLKDLDTATSVNAFDTTAGLLKADGIKFAVSGSLSELLSTGLISTTGSLNGYWTGSTNAVGTAHLVNQISSVEVSLDLQSGDQPLSSADLSRLQVLKESLGAQRPLTLQTPVTALTVKGYESLLGLGATLPAGRFQIVDSPAQIAELLTTAAQAGHANDLQAISSIKSTDANGVIELTYGQYQKLIGDNGSIFDKSSLTNLQLVVSGTGKEIEGLFSVYGSDISKLQVLGDLSFHITDGGFSSESAAGETAITAAVLDRLDGRIEGAVAVRDTSANIALMLEKKIPDVVKEIIVQTVSNSSQLFLTVAQFRNLPAYADAEVVIRDSEINIIRALSYGTLDDRVRILQLKDEVNSIADGGLTLNTATAEALGDRQVFLKSGDSYLAAPLVIRDRASAIANFIETASLPSGISSLKFVESSLNVITLNYVQSVAYQDLKTVLGNGLLSGSTVNFISTDPLAGLKSDVAGVKSDIAGVVTALGQAEVRIKDASDAGDVLTRTALTTARDALINAMGAQDVPLSTQIAGVITALGLAEVRIKDASDAGDVLTRTALTTAKDALIVAIGDSETELATDIAGVITALGLAEVRIKDASDAGDVLTRTALTTARDALIVVVNNGDIATQGIVNAAKDNLLAAIADVKTTVDGLAAEFITVAEFNALAPVNKGVAAFNAGKSYQLQDTAANLANLLNVSVDRTISMMVPSNGAKLQLDAAQHGRLIDANTVADRKLFSGFIDLNDTLANLTALPPSALKAASSWTLTNPKGNAGVTSLPSITVAAGVVLKGATNYADYLYSLSDSAAALASQDVDTVAVVKNTRAIKITGELAAAADLNTISNASELVIDAAGINVLSGSYAAVLAAYNDVAGIAGLGDEAVNLNVAGTVTVADANVIDGKTTGVVTATISNGWINELVTLTGTNNAYTLAVTTASVNAADLNTLDVKTTVKVNALQVGTLTGTAAASAP
ncbi:MAG: hypothetical protein NTZ53_10625 [Cyanobacteria bacterium]|nr:hypothetical protein [Cyanobacteriota bacterium]